MSFDRKGKPKTGPDWRRAEIAWKNRGHLAQPNGEVHHYDMRDLGECWCPVHKKEVRLKGEVVAKGTAGEIANITHCCDETKCKMRQRRGALPMGEAWLITCLIGKRIEAKW